MGPHLSRTVDLFEATVKAFLADNESSLRRLKTDATSLFDALSEERSIYYNMAQQRTSDTKLDRDARYCFYRAYTNMREVGRNLQRLATVSKDHVANRHRVYHGKLKTNLLKLASELQKLARGSEGRHALETIKLNGSDLVQEIDRMQEELLTSISSENISMRGCELYLSFLQFARELVNRYSIVSVLQKELNDLCDQAAEENFDDQMSSTPTADKPLVTRTTRILQALHVTKGPSR